jgi:ATP-dependent Clp protease ATP-binding subunit ClpA
MGPFDRFNDRAKRVLALAQDEAIRFNHNYIGTEHLLLGLVREGEGAAARALDSLGVELSKVRVSVESIIGRGDSTTTPTEITLSPRTKKVIELAIDEARKLGHSHVGTEHLLLGLVREGGHVGAKVLESLGVTLDKVREHVIAILGQPHGYASGPRPDPRDLPSAGPFDLLDRPTKRVLGLAEEEARLMRHNWIGTEHMMIALLRSDGIAQRALEELGVKIDQARAGVFKAVPPREADVTEITITPRVRTLLGKAIMLAAPSADLVRPQHLLLALVADPDGIGSQVLAQLGVTPEKLRVTIDRLSAG